MFLVFLLLATIGGIWAVPGSPDDHTLSFEDEYDQFERQLFTEMLEVPTEGKRVKRTVYLNTETFVAVALLVGVPVSLVLPSLSNLFNKWRNKRSLDNLQLEPIFREEDDPKVKEEMDRIGMYFQLVDIPEHSCQLRAICEFSSDPEKFYPLSEMILSRIRNPKLPPMLHLDGPSQGKGQLAQSSNGTSLFKIYNDAADSGLESWTRCEQNYGKECPYPMQKLLNLPTLRFWNAMQRFLQLKFTDGTLTF